MRGFLRTTGEVVESSGKPRRSSREALKGSRVHAASDQPCRLGREQQRQDLAWTKSRATVGPRMGLANEQLVTNHRAMGRKAFQDFAHILCQRFIEVPTNHDLVNLFIFGGGTMILDVLAQKATVNGLPVKPLPYA